MIHFSNNNDRNNNNNNNNLNDNSMITVNFMNMNQNSAGGRQFRPTSNLSFCSERLKCKDIKDLSKMKRKYFEILSEELQEHVDKTKFDKK